MFFREGSWSNVPRAACPPVIPRDGFRGFALADKHNGVRYFTMRWSGLCLGAGICFDTIARDVVVSCRGE